MAVPLVVVLFVAVADVGDPATLSMTTTAQEMLGADAVVVVRQVGAPPTDEAADALATRLHASAVVEVTWVGTDRRHARLHVHVRGSSAWTDRELWFGVGDPPDERGRTIALNIVGMVPSTAPEEPKVEESKPVVPKPAIEAPAPKVAIVEETPRFGVDLFAQGSRGSDATDFGGALAFAVHLGGPLWIRAGGALRTSELADVGVRLSTTRTFLGMHAELPMAKHFAIGMRLEGVAVRQAISVSSLSERARPHDARWIGAAQLTLEASLLASGATFLVAGLGIEQGFGATDIVVDGATRATLARTRFLGEIGLRARF